MVSNLSFGSGVDTHRVLTGPPDPRQHPFGSGQCPYPASCAGRPAEALATSPGFLSPFGCRPWLLDHPLPAGELGLPYGRLTGEDPSGPHQGYHVPRERDTTGVGAPFTPGRRCSPGWQRIPNRRLPLLNGQSCTPLEHPTCGAKDHEASSGVQSPSPVRSSPCLWSADGTRTLGLLPELRTEPLPATHVGVGTGLEHWPGITLPTSVVGPLTSAFTHLVQHRVALPSSWCPR